MTNGELINEIGELMDKEQMPVAAYRKLMLRSVSGLLDKTDSMDEKLSSVCKDVEKHEDDIKILKKRDNLNNMLTAAMATVAGILGFKN